MCTKLHYHLFRVLNTLGSLFLVYSNSSLPLDVLGTLLGYTLFIMCTKYTYLHLEYVLKTVFSMARV